jgi:hypothetical protein
MHCQLQLCDVDHESYVVGYDSCATQHHMIMG